MTDEERFFKSRFSKILIRCRCGDKVFEAEKMTSGGRLYHQACFTCRECGHRLDYSNCVESSFTFKGVVFVAEAKAVEAGPTAAKAAAAADVYCKTCHVRAFFTGGRNRFVIDDDGRTDSSNRQSGKSS